MSLRSGPSSVAGGAGLWPVVGVVIPVFNDWLRLQSCLAGLARQDYPADRLRIRVVDNGSHDWPASATFPMALEVLHCAEPGSYRARNLAALNWGVDLLAFTDADCLPAPGWLRSGVKRLGAPEEPCGLVAGAIRVVAVTEPACLGEQLDQLFGFEQERSVRRGGYGATANLFVRQSVFEALGGFRAGTRSGADRDFCQRAAAAGHRLAFAPQAVVSHPARRWGELVQKQRRIVGGQLSLAPADPLARLAVLQRAVRPCVRQGWIVLRHRGLAPRQRLHLLVAALALRLLVALEWLRLQWPGQEPLR